MPAITANKRALFDYEILERYEAGMVLSGQEVKSVKTGHVNLRGAFVVIKDGEAWLLNAHIPPYQVLNAPEAYTPTASRKLLLKRREIEYLRGKISQKGLTIVPLKVYTSHGVIKIEIGLARHRKKADKRELLKKRDAEREIRHTS
ncbi:MAG: SsrA-binding protein SmpB [bacterium]|nr:SsrA-binding protein SmpB [bacterium]MDZ4296398.1 SsrA-binding protein SmpB [Patescibacteria group bacterium]